MPRLLADIKAQYAEAATKEPGWVAELARRLQPAIDDLREFLQDKDLREHGESLFQEIIGAAILEHTPTIDVSSVQYGAQSDDHTVILETVLGSEDAPSHVYLLGINAHTIAVIYLGPWSHSSR